MTLLFSAWRLPALVVLFAFVSACGGGGGGGGGDTGNGPNKPPQVVDAPNSYLPTDPAIRWTYNDSIQARFEAPVNREGRVLHSYVYPTGGKEYFTTSATHIGLEGLYLPYINVGGMIYTGDIHFDAPLTIFENGWTYTGKGVSGEGTIDVSPTYGSRKITYAGGVNYTADWPVYTKQGIYTAKIVSVSLTFSVTVDGTVVSFPYSVNFFFVDGLGIIQRVQDNVEYKLTALTGGLDADEDGILDTYDRFPNDGNRWEVSPLYASDDGIALVSLPSHARLEQTVTVMQGNGPAPVVWSSSSDQSWLTAVQEAGSRLRLVADPSGLAPDTLYEGTISIQADSADVVDAPALIRVGLWVGSQDAPTASTQTVGSEEKVVDPVRPYIYVIEGNDFSIYNIYTEAKIGNLGVSLANTPAFTSTDGEFIFVQSAAGLQQVSLRPPYEAHVLLGTGPGWQLAYARPQGHPTILDQHGGVFDIANGTGTQLVHRQWVSPLKNVPPAVSVQGNRVCGVNTVAALELECYELSYVNGQYKDVRVKGLGSDSLTSYTHDLAISDDGQAVYVATGNSGIIRYDVHDVGGGARLPTPGNFDSVIELGVDGFIYAGNDSYIYRFSPNLALTRTFNLITSLPRVSISSDGAVMMDGEVSNLRYWRTY